jgi:hypothetical protein
MVETEFYIGAQIASIPPIMKNKTKKMRRIFLTNIFIGTKELQNINIGDTLQHLPHGKLFIPIDEDDAGLFVDNYLITGHSINFPHINIFENNKDGYKLISKEFIPDWKYIPVDWNKEESIGTEYSLELFEKITSELLNISGNGK